MRIGVRGRRLTLLGFYVIPLIINLCVLYHTYEFNTIIARDRTSTTKFGSIVLHLFLLLVL